MTEKNKTLYDVLEVSPSANTDVIQAAYQRIRERFQARAAQGDEDALNQLKLAREAAAVLTHAERRARYDADRRAAQSAATRPRPLTIEEEESAFRGRRAWLIGLAIAGLLAYGMYVREQAITERTRAFLDTQRELVNQQQSLEQERIEAAERRNEGYAVRSVQTDDERRRRYERERFEQEARRIKDQQEMELARAEQAKRMEAARRQASEREAEYQQERQAREAARTAAREQAQLREICLQRYNRPDC